MWYHHLTQHLTFIGVSITSTHTKKLLNYLILEHIQILVNIN